MPIHSSIAQERQVAIVVALTLLVATYFAFSIRSITDPFVAGEMLSLKRLVVAGVGAAMFWLVAAYARRNWAAHVPARLTGVALLSAAALGCVLAARIAFDLLTLGQSEQMLVRNMRWTIIWLGYFGTALLGYFTIVFGIWLRSAVTLGRGTRQDRLAAVLNEVSTWPASERRMLVAMLDRPVPYEEADPLFAGLHAR